MNLPRSDRIADWVWPGWLLLGVFFVVGFSIRLAFLFWRGVEVAPDSADYFRLSQNLIAQGVFSLNTAPPYLPSIRWPPGYPFFLATLNLLGASTPFLIAIIQGLLDSVTAVLLLLIARATMPLKFTLAVSAFYLVHPAALSGSRAVLTETLFTFLLVSAVGLLCFSFKRDSLWRVAGSGVIFGLAILSRSVALFLPFIGGGLLVLFLRNRRSVVMGVVLIAGAFVVITPWAVRSSRVAGRTILVQDPVSFSLLLFAASHWDWDQRDQARLWPRCEAERRRLEGVELSQTSNGDPSRLRSDKILLAAALNNIRQSPVRYITSRLANAPYLFLSSYDQASGINQSFAALESKRDLPRLFMKSFLLVFFSLLPFLFGVIGLAVSRTLPAVVCASIWLYMLLFHIPIWLEPRYFAPSIPFLLISAALGVKAMLTLGSRKISRANASDEIQAKDIQCPST